MTVTIKDLTMIKVTFGGLSAPFPQNVSAPGLKVGDVVLTVTSSTGLIVSGSGSASTEGIITVDDQIRVVGSLDDVSPYTVILARL